MHINRFSLSLSDTHTHLSDMKSPYFKVLSKCFHFIKNARWSVRGNSMLACFFSINRFFFFFFFFFWFLVFFGFWFLVFGFWFFFFFGFWFLVFGFGFLVFGFWFLVFGFWFLVFGFWVLVFLDRVSPCSLGCPGTHFVEQAGLELRNLSASVSQVLGLKVCATMPSFNKHFLLDIYFIYISNVVPFPAFPSENPHPLPSPPVHQPTHTCFLALAFPYTGA
jgi:hypothetical protein